MVKKKEDSEKIIADLKSELEASMRREDILLGGHGAGSEIKRVLKNTALGRAAQNPNSKVGKVVRAPRTVYRIIRKPSILKEIYGGVDKGNEKKSEEVSKDLRERIVPIDYFYGVNNPKRINLVVKELSNEMVKKAVMLANVDGSELRVVTFSESVDPLKFNEIVEKEKLPKLKKISFYSSVDQDIKDKVFKLEIGKNDIFLTALE